MADELGITTTAAPPPASPDATPAPAPAPAPAAADPIQEANRVAGPLGAAALGALKSATDHTNTPEPTPPAAQPSGKTITMRRSDGVVGDVPEEQATEAAKKGYRTVVQMTKPTGEPGYVPVEQSHDALAKGYKFGAPIKDTSSIGAAPTISGSDIKDAVTEAISPFKVNQAPIKKVSKAIDDAISSIENYTPQGRAEHPALAQVGDLIRSAKGLLFGTQSTGNPFGTSSGLVNNPVTMAMAAAPEAAELGATAEDTLVPKIKSAASKIGEVTEDMFKHAPEVPKAQHGAPVPVDSPLDRATVNATPGGKELSEEAFNTLQKHVGDTVPAGSTPKNTMMRGVKPVLRTIEDAGSQMNKVIGNAPAFETSLMDDANATGPFIAKSATGEGIREGWQGRDFVNSLASEQETGILKDIQDIRENLPLKTDDPLNKVVDTQFRANEPALNSTDPKELLAARRKLGNTIDWANITWNPETPGEVANTTKVKLYHAMGNKLKTEIPEVAELDKILQPNLELRSHFDAKLGKAVSRDPVEAEAQASSEHQKGLAQLENEAHNAKVNKNIAIAKKVATMAGAGAAGAIGFDLAK